MPYQAVRLRITAHNAPRKRVGPLVSLAERFQIKGPGQATYRSVLGWWVTEPQRLTGDSNRTAMNDVAPLYLGPHEDQTSLSVALAADFESAPKIKVPKGWPGAWSATPVFTEPGKYSIRCEATLLPKQAKPVERVIVVEVPEPRGDDKAVFEMLKKDTRLTDVLLFHYTTAHEPTVAKLEDILKRFPKSSYADYVRLALARAYSEGTGLVSSSIRVRVAHTADLLEQIVKDRFDPRTKKHIPNRFAYMPEALILWLQAEERDRVNTVERLGKEYPDALPWLEVIAKSLSNPKWEGIDTDKLFWGRTFPEDPEVYLSFRATEWRDYRKRIPEERKPRSP